MTTPQTKRRIRVSIISKYSRWVAIRVFVLIALFALEIVVYRFGGLDFFGEAETQERVYVILQRVLLSLVVWFFLECSKKIIIPAAIITCSSVLGKLVHDPASAKRTNKTLSRYLTYIVYFISIVSLVLIWTYHLIGPWVSSILGSSLVIRSSRADFLTTITIT
jgi:hypothetical protein